MAGYGLLHGFLLMHSVIGAPFMQIASGDFPEMARWRGKKHGGSRVGSSYPKMQLVSPRKQLSQTYFQWNHPTYHHEIAFRTSRRAMKIGLLCLQSPCSRLFRMRWRRTWAEGTCIAEERNKLKGLMGRIFSPKKTFKLSWTSQTSWTSSSVPSRRQHVLLQWKLGSFKCHHGVEMGTSGCFC